jgi:hypothetical protein
MYILVFASSYPLKAARKTQKLKEEGRLISDTIAV